MLDQDSVSVGDVAVCRVEGIAKAPACQWTRRCTTRVVFNAVVPVDPDGLAQSCCVEGCERKTSTGAQRRRGRVRSGVRGGRGGQRTTKGREWERDERDILDPRVSIKTIKESRVAVIVGSVDENL